MYWRRYESRRSPKPKLHLKKTKILNTAENDFQYVGCSSFTLQCGMWLWDDMPLNSPVRHIGILLLVSISTYSYHRSQHVILHQSAKFYHVDLQDLGFYESNNGFFKSPCTTSYRSSIKPIALNFLIFDKITLFILATDRRTNKLTNKQWTSPSH